MKPRTAVAKQNHHSRKKLDLTGKRFGKLIVLAPAENIGKRTAWLCRCDCGNEVVRKTVHLQEAHVTTCGCEGIVERLTLVDKTCLEMLSAKTVRKNNSSGITGVDWLKGAQRWRATICFQGGRLYLGKFVRFEDAVRARKAAEAEYHDAFVRQYREGGECSENASG